MSSLSFNAEKIASEAWRVAQEAVNEKPTEPGEPMTEEELEAIELERERELLERKRLAAEEARIQEEQRIKQEKEQKRIEAEEKAAERAAEIKVQTGEGGVIAKAKGFDKGIGVGGKRRHQAPEGEKVKKMAAIFEVRGGAEQGDDERTKKPVKMPSQKKMHAFLRRESGLSGFDPAKMAEDAQDSSKVSSL